MKPSERIMELYQANIKKMMSGGSVLDFARISTIAYSDAIVEYLDESSAPPATTERR